MATADDGPVRYGTLSPGDIHHQGDVGLMCIAAMPCGIVGPWQHGMQLSEGTTQGSRHIIQSGSVEILEWKKDSVLLGPVIKAKSEFTVGHPEHGDVTLPAGMYAVTYPASYAEELRRVAD